MSTVGDDGVSSNTNASEHAQEIELDDGDLDADLNVVMMGVQDCRLEGRAFGTKTSIILTANGVLLAIIASSFSRLEPWTAAMSIGAIILSAYRAISVLRVDMDVLKLDAPWEDTIIQNLDDGKFIKLFLAYKLVQIETKNQGSLANMAIKWDNAAQLLLAAIMMLTLSLMIHTM